MAFLLFAGLGTFLYFAGDQVSSWLLPSMPPDVGRLVLLAALLLVAALLFAPTRFLAQAIVTGTLTVFLVLCRVAAQGFLAMSRLMWTGGRTAVGRFMGDLR